MRLRTALLAASFCVAFAPTAFADDAALPLPRLAPPGFREIRHEEGVTVWRNRKSEYAQVISPHRGAVVKLLQGGVLPTEGEGTNFARRNLMEWWETWKEEHGDALSIANGQFFNMNDPAKSPIAFSTKIDGIVYVGYGDGNEYGGKKMLLRIGKRYATVEPYADDAGTLYDFPEPDVIVGLRPDVSKAGNRKLGRTFMGTMQNGNLLVFTSPAATQRYAERMLLAFGAQRGKVMMLDGGGSTQLILDGDLVTPKGVDIDALRAVPLAIGVTKGTASVSENN